jgi:RNA polymerase sigma-70 factor (ECF subfamily)
MPNLDGDGQASPGTASSNRRSWFEREVIGLLPDLYSAALRLAKNEPDAEDLVAEAVAKAWMNLGSLKARATFRGWVFRILTNSFISRCRSRAAQGIHEPLEEAEGPDDSFSLFDKLHQPFLLWWGNPEQEFLNKLLREDLQRAVDALPEPFRVVVVLADVQGFSYREIAETLEVPVGTVRSRLARARALLQKALWSQAVDAGLVGPSAEATPNR